MELFNNFKSLFLSVWEKGILGVDIFEILIGVGIFFIFNPGEEEFLLYKI